MLLYHDFASPLSRVGMAVVLRAAARTGRPLGVCPFELWPDPGPGVEAGEAGFREELEAARKAAGDGVVWNPPSRMPRTRKAHEAVAAAESQGGPEAGLRMAVAIYDALWAGGRDVGRIDVLAELAAEAGLDAGALHIALGIDQTAEAVARSQRRAERSGVAGVPILEVAGERIVGLVAEDELVAWLDGLETTSND